MKGKTNASPPPYLKKGFKSALDCFFRENVQQLGGEDLRDGGGLFPIHGPAENGTDDLVCGR